MSKKRNEIDLGDGDHDPTPDLSISAKRRQHHAAIRRKDYDAEVLRVENALTDEEKVICQNVVTFGPEYLRHHSGWKRDAIKMFLERREVVREIETLKRQYEDRAAIQERTQFFAQLKINSMVPRSLNILARTLQGDVKGADGRVIPAPTRAQYEAAVEVLNRANIQGSKWAGNDSTPLIDARSVTIAADGKVDNVALDASGREKVRGILSAIVGRAKAAAQADDMLSQGVTRDVKEEDGP